jgi:hypothetical protein
LIWVVLGIGATAAIYFVVRNRTAATALARIDHSKEQAAHVPEHEKQQLSEEIRATALAGYDRGSAAAKGEGASDRFAHEVGVLDAIYCVVANKATDRQDANLRERLQMEGLPFNSLQPEEGRAAVAEYLVWKFFPGQADLSVLKAAMDEFNRVVFEKAKQEPEPDRFIHAMIYAQRYDWQTLAIERAQDAAS